MSKNTIDPTKLTSICGGQGPARAGYNAEDVGQGLLWGAAGATAGAAGGPIGAGLGGAAGFGAGFMSRNVNNLTGAISDLWRERQRGAALDKQIQARRAGGR
jgi:hypothetical protein